MTKQDLYEFIRQHDLAVMATVSPSLTSESALVVVAVTPELELIFDTVRSSRKYTNLKENPSISFVIGWKGEITLQYEGVAEEPVGDELQLYKSLYFERYPDGRSREVWPGIVYFKVRPTWIRYCDYNPESRELPEFTFE
ncbi:MAG: pyridoxamine 5'-phosphate oxidase family protein [Bryobacteraceae bacterium]